MKLHYNGLSSLASCLFGLLAGTLLTLMFILPRAEKLNETHAQDYGNALATLAASQAIDAAFNHDLVSLQLILSDVMENPRTLLATIHDVENNLLVQAGDSRSFTKGPNTYTAPIVLHDSIAGYVSVTISAQPVLGRSLVMLLLAVITAILAGLIWELRRHSSFELEFTGKRTADNSLENRKNTESTAEDSDDCDAIDPEQIPRVYTIIQLKNLEVLRQQLNGENFRKTLGELELVVSDVLALYNGAGYRLTNDSFELTFYANDATNEALFRATCSAWLILEIGSIVNNIPLDLAALVSANHLDLIPTDLPCAGLLLEEQAAGDELIQRRVCFLDVGEAGRKMVSGFEQPFQSLLEKQRHQLAEL